MPGVFLKGSDLYFRYFYFILFEYILRIKTKHKC